MIGDINVLPILVSAIVSMAIGALWYSPALFGKKWMHYTGMTMENMQKNKNKALRGYLIGFVASIVMAYVLLEFIDYSGAETFADGAKTGLWAWLGFIVPVTLGGYLWEGKPIQLFLMNAAYYLVSLIIMGGILASWL